VEKSDTYMRQPITVKERLGHYFKISSYWRFIYIMNGDLYTDQLEVVHFEEKHARQSSQSEQLAARHLRARKKNRLALARPAAASIRGKCRGETGIHFVSLAARGVLAMCVHGFREMG
jgi:hypothetical protein